mgnify:CR=1 FL=1
MNNSLVFFNSNDNNIQNPINQITNTELKYNSEKNVIELGQNPKISSLSLQENLKFLENYQKNINNIIQNDSILNCKPEIFANQIDFEIQKSLHKLNNLNNGNEFNNNVEENFQNKIECKKLIIFFNQKKKNFLI